MDATEMESLASRLDAEARKHIGELNADLLSAAQIVREAVQTVRLLEGRE